MSQYYSILAENGNINPYQDATLAFSLRDLGLGASHVVRVRRSIDNVEQDFTANQIIDGTLTSFCGAGDGFVAVWYDQKGNFNFTQPTALRQPQIVNTGNLNLLNGKPLIKRVSDDATMISDYAPNGNNRKVFFVGEMTYTNKKAILIGAKTSNSDYNMVNTQGSANTLINSNSVLSSERLNGSVFNYSTRDDIYNSFLQQRLLIYTAAFNFNDNSFCLGYRPLNATNGLGMYEMQELILFETQQNTPQIETEINNHYNIF